MKRIFKCIFSIVLLLAVNNSYAQPAVGDYGTAAAGPASWVTAANWVVCVTAGTWTGATVAPAAPTNAKNCFIRAGHTIQIPSGTPVCANLVVDGTIDYNNGGANRALTISGNLTVSATGSISSSTTSTSNTHTLSVTGNIANAGTINFNTNVRVNTVLNGTTAQAISGAGSFSFWGVTVSNITAAVTSTVAIPINSTLTVNASAVFAASATITTNGGASIAGTFQLNNGGFATAGTWTYTATTGTLAFANTGSNYTVNSGDVYWPTTAGPYNVNVSTTGGINLGAARTVPTTGTAGTFQAGGQVTGSVLTLNGTAQINANGFFTTTPTYGASSTLIYATASTSGTPYGVGNEWTGSSSSPGSGIPNNVTISNNTFITMPGGNRGAAGALTVGAGSGITLNATAGDLSIGGNFAQNGTLTHNTRAINFFGTTATTQTISGTGLNSTGATNCFAYFLNNTTGTGGVTIGVNATIIGTSGDVLQLLNAGPLKIGAFTLTLNGNGGNIFVSGGTRVIDFTAASGILKIQGTTGTLKTITSAASGLLSITSSTAGGQVQVQSGGLDCGSGLTTFGSGSFLTILSSAYVANNSATYATGSTLSFRTGGTYGVGSGDKTWAFGTSGAGVPDKVEVNLASTIVNINEDRTARSTVTVTTGTINNNTNALNVATALSVAATAFNINGGTFSNGGGTVNIGVTGGGNQAFALSAGSFTLSSGTINLNGNYAQTATSTFTQSGGTLIIDGNSGTSTGTPGTAGTSVASGTHHFAVSSSTGTSLNCTAGAIRIIDPPFSASTLASTRSVSLSYSTAPTAYQFSGTHTFEFGDGTSSTAGNTDGFIIESFASSIIVPINNVIANAGNTNTGRWVSSGYGGSTYATAILGNLTINANSEFRNNTVAGEPLYIKGNITNAGTFTSTQNFTLSSVAFNSTTGGTTNTTAQTISGAGTFRNLTASPTAKFTSITFDNNTAGSAINFNIGDVTLTAAATFTNGIIDIGNNNSFNFISSTSSATRTNGYVLIQGIGQMKKDFTGAAAFTYYIGENTGTTEFSPATLTFTTLTPASTIGVRPIDAKHPNIDDVDVQTDYISRYWQVSNTAATSYAYTGTFTYLPGDINGTEANIKAGIWTGATPWAQLPSSAASNVLTISSSVTQITAPLGAIADFTGRVKLTASTYTWNQTGTAAYGTAANWTPSRGVPSSNDILIFNGSTTPTPTVTGFATETIGKLLFTNNANVNLQSAAAATLTISGGAGTDLDIPTGSTLNFSGTNTIGVAFSGTTTTTIAGTLTYSTSAGTATLNLTNTVATITGTINFSTTTNAVTVTGTTGTLLMNAGSNMNITTLQTIIPLATWAATANITFSGTGTSFTNNTQSFGNFIYNSSVNAATLSFFTSGTVSIQGNVDIQATGSGKFRFVTSGSVTIGGNLTVSNAASADIASSAGSVTVNGNFTHSSTGTTFIAPTTSTATLNVGGTFNVSNGIVDLAASSSVGTIKVAGTYNHTAGTVTESGTTTSSVVEFNGSSSQSVTTSGTVSNIVNYRVNNAAGIVAATTLNINASASLRISTGTVTSGTVAYNASASTLTYDATAATQTTTSIEFPVTNGPANLTINNTNATPNVSLHASRTIAGVFTLTAGRIVLGSSDLTLDAAATVSGTPSATKMVVTDGAGQLKKIFATGASSFTFPVGETTGTTEYSPNTLSFTANSIQRTIGVRVIDATHPNINTGTTPVDYLSRYWSFTDDQAGTYTYTSSFTYVAGAPDVNGTEANIRVGRWNGTAWTQQASSISSPTLTITTSLTETTGPLNANDFTGRTTPLVTYTWTGATSTDWATNGNWSVAGFPNATNQNVVINTAGGNQPVIATGSNYSVGTLTLNNATGSLTLNGTAILTPTGATTITAGVITLNGTSRLNASAGLTNAAGGTIAVSTGYLNLQSSFSNAGTITSGTTGTIEFGIPGGTIPRTISYGNLTVSGAGTFLFSAAGAVSVAGNYSQPGSTTASTIVTLAGSAQVNTMIVGGNFDVSGGNATFPSTFRFVASSSAASNATVAVTGNATLAGSGRINLESTSSTTAAGILNVTGNFTSTSTIVASTGSDGAIDFGLGTVTGNAINIAGNFDKSGVGTFGTASTNAATGFVFNKSGTQTFSYAGAASDYVNHTVNSTSTLQMLSGYAISTATSPVSIFTINGTIDMGTNSITGGTTSGTFTVAAAGTIKTANTLGIGNTTGASFSGFTTGTTLVLTAGAKYEFNASGAQTTGLSGLTLGTPNSLTASGTTVLTPDINFSFGASATLNVNTGATLVAGTRTFTFGTGGVVTVDGTLQTANVTATGALSGSATSTIVNTNTPTVTLNSGSVIEFNAAAAQAINSRTYGGVKISNGNVVNMGGTVTVNSTLNLNTGDINIAGNSLVLNGPVTRTSGNIRGSVTSNLTANGTTGSLFFLGTGTSNYLKTFTIGAAGSATLGNALNITAYDGVSSEGVLTVTAGGSLASAGFLTIKSNLNGTARIAQGSTGGGYITGNVTVERYILQNSAKQWRLLASTTSGQTVNASWQEGQVGYNVNTNPGFGTMIAGPGVSLAAANSAGFDTLSYGYSLFKYNKTTDGLDAVPNTLTQSLAAEHGYFIFIRGDRGPNQFNTGVGATPTPPTSATVLRSTGTLFTGDQAAVATDATKHWAIVRNPYPSRIDMRQIVRGIGLVDAFQVWDPKLGGAFGVGGYQTFTKSGSDYTVAPGSGSYGSIGSTENFIESGAAFFIQSSGGSATAQVTEACKTSSSSNASFRPASPLSGNQRMSYTLSANNNGSVDVVDGGLVFFDNAYSNAIDVEDVRKSFNFAENFGNIRNSTDLVVERRQAINGSDTVFFNMNQMRSIGYNLEVAVNDVDPLITTGILQDKFTGNNTVLDLSGASNTYTFMVDGTAASKAADRFRIVFKQSTVVPVSFVSVRAAQSGSNIAVEWKVANQLNVHHYEVEESADGRSFSRSAAIAANNGMDYNWLDQNIVSGYNYYRVKSVDNNGQVKSTDVVKVFIGKAGAAITIAPNPVQGNYFNIQFTEQAAGKYGVRLINIAGQVVYNRTVEHNGGSASQSFALPSALVSGMYQLEITKPDNTKKVEKLIVNTGN